MSVNFPTDKMVQAWRAGPPTRGLPDPRRHLKVLAPIRYPWTFNGPRRSRHDVVRRPFVPFNWLRGNLDGFTIFNPWHLRGVDLIHAYNRVPIGKKPFVIGFESHLPRAFGMEGGLAFRAMTRALASPRCRGIVAISEHAAKIFEEQHKSSFHENALHRKLSVRYPNVVVPPPKPARIRSGGALRLAFVGNHFARKGGCVAVKVAEMALKRSLPVEVTIVSSLHVGGSIWTDPEDRSFFQRYFKLLDLPNVSWTSSMPNPAVGELLRRSDLSLLTTFGDTCGFSAIESLAQGTPVIATRQGALPEIIDHESNGYLLPIALNAHREWIHLGSDRRHTRWFEGVFEHEVDRLALMTVDIIESLMASPACLPRLQQAAHVKASTRFCSKDSQAFWDNYYVEALGYEGLH